MNDTGGHAAGDAMLKEVAAALAKHVRASDTVARLGGDEFAAILEGCTAQRATGIAEAMRAAVAGLRLAFEGRVYTVGISIGVAPADGQRTDAKAAMAAADAACYAAKGTGRDRVAAG